MGKALEDILGTGEASDRASNCASVVEGEASPRKRVCRVARDRVRTLTLS